MTLDLKPCSTTKIRKEQQRIKELREQLAILETRAINRSVHELRRLLRFIEHQDKNERLIRLLAHLDGMLVPFSQLVAKQNEVNAALRRGEKAFLIRAGGFCYELHLPAAGIEEGLSLRYNQFHNNKRKINTALDHGIKAYLSHGSGFCYELRPVPITNL